MSLLLFVFVGQYLYTIWKIFKVFARMELKYLLHQMKMYPFQDLNNIVNFPAISMYIVDLVSCVVVNTKLVRLYDCFGLVDDVTCLVY